MFAVERIRALRLLDAAFVRSRLWHPSQELRELPGGRLELRLRVADVLEVRRWLLGFGAEVEVLEPPALRQAIRREAERLLTMLAPARKPLAKARGPGATRAAGGAARPAPPARRRGAGGVAQGRRSGRAFRRVGGAGECGDLTTERLG
jgi:hypothetical protein